MRAYKERFFDALVLFAEGILDANLGEKHFLSRIVGRILHDFQVFTNYIITKLSELVSDQTVL